MLVLCPLVLELGLGLLLRCMNGRPRHRVLLKLVVVGGVVVIGFVMALLVVVVVVLVVLRLGQLGAELMNCQRCLLRLRSL